MNLVEFENGVPTKEDIEALSKRALSIKVEELEKIHNNLIQFNPRVPILVDDWVPDPEDQIFKSVDKAIILPVSKYYGLGEDDSNDLDFFIIAPKRCYNREVMRDHTTQYLNYFEKFYDTDHELVLVYYHLKYIMDLNDEYNKANFISDINRYILRNRSILNKLFMMNEDNYIVELKAKKGKYVPNLQYNTKHGKLLMQMSILMNMVIPLVTHFAYLKSVDNIDGLLLEVFDDILYMSSVNMYNKFYETATSEVERNKSIHSTLWAMQDIRAKNITTHSKSSIENIILNIMPKYNYNQNIIAFNSTSIRRNTGYKITDIKYEFNYTLLSSSNRDREETSVAPNGNIWESHYSNCWKILKKACNNGENFSNVNDLKSCLIINQIAIYYYRVTINYCNTYIAKIMQWIISSKNILIKEELLCITLLQDVICHGNMTYADKIIFQCRFGRK